MLYPPPLFCRGGFFCINLAAIFHGRSFFSFATAPYFFCFICPWHFCFLQRSFKKDIVILSYEKIPIPSIGYFNVVLRKRAKP